MGNQFSVRNTEQKEQTVIFQLALTPSNSLSRNLRCKAARGAMSSFVGGQLNLKGGSGVDKKKKKKKKKSKDGQDGAASLPNTEEVAKEVVIHKTPAQIKHEEYVTNREKSTLSKTASKSHRQRISEYNEKLSKLTEHNDIPKVGPG